MGLDFFSLTDSQIDIMEITKNQSRIPVEFHKKAAWLARVLADPKLSQASKNVAASLFLHHNQTTGQCNPRQARLAKAVGITQRGVNGIISKLRDRGWITVLESERHAACDYVLMVDHAVGEVAVEFEVPADEPQHTDTEEGVRTGVRRGYEPTCVGGTNGGAQGVRMAVRTEQRSEPRRGTVQPNRAPAEGREGKEEDLSAGSSKVLVPANDDVDHEVIHNIHIPGSVIARWVTAFPDTNVRGALGGIVHWLKKQRQTPEDRLVAIEATLAKRDEQGRRQRLDRMATAQATAAAPSPKPPKSRFQI